MWHFPPVPKTRQFVLTLKDARPPGPDDLAQVEQSSARILDRAGRSLKVETLEQNAAKLSQQLPSWHVAPEIEYKVPDTRRRIDPAGG